MAAAKFSAQVQANLTQKVDSTSLGAGTLSSLASQLGTFDPINPPSSLSGEAVITAPPPVDVSSLKVNKKKTVVRATKKYSKVETPGQSGAKR